MSSKSETSVVLNLFSRWRVLFIWFMVLTMLFPIGPSRIQAQAQENEKFLIRFKTRDFIPSAGLEVDAIRAQWVRHSNISPRRPDRQGTRRVHFLVQFRELPNFREKQRIANQGIRLLNYVTGNTYIASASISKLSGVRNMRSVRWAGPLLVGDKMGPDLQAGNVGFWAQAPNEQVMLTLQLHPDVTIAQGEALVASLGGQLVSVMPTVPAVTAIFPSAQTQRVAQQDIVQYVDMVDLPLEPHNDGAGGAANVTPLAQAPYNLDGTGVTILVYDGGQIDAAHPDFGTRVIQNDGSLISDHATHVAGTVGGSGANSNGNDSAGNPNGGTANQWAGMAPGVNIRSFGTSGFAADFYDGGGGDINADFTTAINNGIDLATMSLGNNVVPAGFPCGQLGDYTNTAILIDNIVRGSIAGQQLIYIESAGNERGGSLAACGITFSTISSPATAKNSIAVGAINSNDNTITGFTSFGPTDDGRLKPDISAPGCQTNGDGTITSPSFDDVDPDGAGPLRRNRTLDPGEVRNSYVAMCGTSMSTPVVSGATSLLIEQWRSTRGAGSRPLPHTVKAILAHTATDRGNAGPDYQFGWGTLDARAAVDFVIADDTADLIHVDQVDNTQTDFYTFNSNGFENVRVTAAWSDPVATRLAAVTLINDLDLRLIDPDGTVYQPFTLDPANPGNAAGRGNDARNNVEMVIGTAKAGTWTVTVAGTAVPQGPQQYTLLTPVHAALNQPPTANAGGPYSTNEGTDRPLIGSGTDPDDVTLSYAWDFNYDGVTFDVDDTSQNPNFSNVGQDGIFNIALRVTDPDEAFDIDQTTVTVNNVPPSLTLSADAPKDEGSPVTITGTATDPGWLEALTATVNWADGSPIQTIPGSLENTRPDATFTFNTSHSYGDNGTYNAQVCALDDDSTTCQIIVLQIDNVAPTVQIAPGQVTEINEGDIVDVAATFSDPGWLDTYTSEIDWGTGETEAGTITMTSNGPPMDQGLVSGSHQYGDNGLFTVTITVTDDDGGSDSGSFDLTVHNISPSAQIDTSGTTLIHGIPTFMGHAGDPLDFSARSEDPGSDDLYLSWDWDDGPPSPDVTTTYLVNPPNPDPFPSPSVQPVDVTDMQTHAFADACLFEISFLADDDDGGHNQDHANVIVTGNADRTRSEGYWQHQYSGNGSIDFDEATLECYLAIAGYMSSVFDELRDASTIENAHDVLFLRQNGGSALEQFDRELLTLWLNFANGSLDYSVFIDEVAAAEAVRLDPNATERDLREQTRLLHQINN